MTHVLIYVVDRDDPWVSSHFRKLNGGTCNDATLHGVLSFRFTCRLSVDMTAHEVLDGE